MSGEGLQRLNAMSDDEAIAALMQCCGSRTWAGRLAAKRPFDDEDALYDTAERIWRTLPADAVREAFDAHPRIGERNAAAPQTAAEQDWSATEQSGMRDADAETAEEMARLQRLYEDSFGHIFLICATGLSADDMLAALRARLRNDTDEELRVAADEQMKITRLRLEKLLNS